MNNLTLTLVLGVPRGTPVGLLLDAERGGVEPLSSLDGLSAGVARTPSTDSGVSMRVGGTHLHTDQSVWVWGSQGALLAHPTSIALVPSGELNSSWCGVSLRWSRRS